MMKTVALLLWWGAVGLGSPGSSSFTEAAPSTRLKSPKPPDLTVPGAGKLPVWTSRR